MLYKFIFGVAQQSRHAWLYSVVFGSRLSFAAVLLLMLSFLVQPIDQAFAEEDAGAVTPADSVELAQDAEPEPEPEPEIESPGVPTVPAETEVVAETTVSLEEAVASTERSPQAPATTTQPAPVKPARTSQPTSTESTANQRLVTEDRVSVDNDETVAPSPTTASTSVGSDAVVVTAPTTTASADANTPSTTAATTSSVVVATSSEVTVPVASADPVAEPEPADTVVEPVTPSTNTPQSTVNDVDTTAEAESDEAVSEEDGETDSASTTTKSVDAESVAMVTNDENFYQFTRQSCVPVGDGNFHCSVAGEAEIDTQSVVYAARGASGNREIFIRRSSGEEEQITRNDYEDTAPQYDPDSQQMVWQRNIDGRYQIIVYDVKRGRESQLTFSRTNNMEPAVSAAGVVWQAWDGNDWEIMHYDGTYTDQITNNESQDIGPSIEEEYILWSVPGQKEQAAKVYSLTSKEITTVSGHEGGSILNPRFVLVYDTKFDNGDVITQSFDPETGRAQPIASTPAPEPIDIPRPDPIGEIRALIQNKSTSEKDQIVKQATTTDIGNLDLASTTATSSADSTLVLTPDDEATSMPAVPEEPDFELTEYDLVITRDGVSTSSAATTSAPATIPVTSSSSATSTSNS